MFIPSARSALTGWSGRSTTPSKWPVYPIAVESIACATLLPISAYSPAKAKRTRVFNLAMSGMVHTINGELFNMERVDFSVPFGDLEIWEYRNTGTDPHPMHAHAALCQVLSRSGGAELRPEDAGWKDTVLVNPGETVRVLTRFETHAGVFLHHCHNLEHESAGKMRITNFAVFESLTWG